jgi:hypothetical protein
MDAKGGFLAVKAVVSLIGSILLFLGDFVKHYEQVLGGEFVCFWGESPSHLT